MEAHVTELLPAYALDCLTEAEARQVADHLATCEHCRGELQTYRETVGRLALAVPQVEPPAALEGRLMKRVQTAPSARADFAPRLSWWQLLLGAAPRLAPVWGLASLVLILVLGASNVLLWQQLNRSRGTTDTPTMHMVTLEGSENTPEANGLIIVSHDGRYGALVVSDLPMLDAARQYQLWLIKGDQCTSGAVFSVDADGYISIEVHSPEPLGRFTSFGVTIEPAGGSPHPTGENVLSGGL